MNRFLKKIIDSLLKKTEQLNNTLESTPDQADDPLQKKIQSLLEKRDLLKTAVNNAAQQTNPVDNSVPEAKPLDQMVTESLAIKKTPNPPPPKPANNFSKNKPSKPKRGR